MIWQYRLFQHDDGEVEVVEVMYEDGGASGWTQMFAPRAESVDKLREVVFDWMQAAFGKRVLNRSDFGLVFCCDEHKPDGDDRRTRVASTNQHQDALPTERAEE